MTVFCVQCGLPAAKSITAYGARNECCGQWSWGDKPLAGAATHDARQRAHDAFDPLWRDGHLSRAEAYQALQWATGLSEKNCHMAKMSKERCERVIAAVDKIWAVLRGEAA